MRVPGIRVRSCAGCPVRKKAFKASVDCVGHPVSQPRGELGDLQKPAGNLAYGDLGRPTQAIAAYKKAVTIKPDFASAYLNMGGALYELGQYAEAVAAYENACKVRKVADLLDDLAVAAVSGRVRRLWLGADRRVPGRVDPESGRILEAEQGDVDVFEALAVIVVRYRGEVRVIEPSGMPAKLGAFAELR